MNDSYKLDILYPEIDESLNTYAVIEKKKLTV